MAIRKEDVEKKKADAARQAEIKALGRRIAARNDEALRRLSKN